ncbi:murein hydrolase activator EnvC family protein [Anaerobranca gottschalkii]|uniref:Septal ring factor EnvC, activator of murein hydrolases AmiA and AmiB n=1 Tax=Anaerobranca gottschalkii DSM 13577 TaxID=1120990 RepID=A0A1H9ZI92_9FIRM|nr:M23 family metallopeptidase [Anaerobranca gottschalkii]SES80546.1 Septal ring factor EnvC, activator of murein hydrolases AmiA and AmiB [Anaerobranca gottschalkii DSM 13577]
MGKLKVILIIALSLILTLSAILPAWANQLDEKRDELKEVQRGINEAEREKKELEDNIREIQRNIAQIEEELVQQRRRVDSINTEIKNTELLIQLKEQEIAETERYLEEQTAYFEARMRALYQRGSVGYLEVLLSATNFSDFITRFNFLRTMIEDDVRLVEEIKEKKAFLEEERIEQVNRRQRLIILKEEALDVQVQIEKNMAEQNALARKLQSQMHRLDSYIKQMEEALKEIEAEIKKMEEEIRKRQQQNTGQTTGKYAWPVPEFGYAWITSHFGPRWGGMHWGVDIGIPHNRWPASPNYIGRPADVVAADGGEVIIAVGRSGAPTDRGFLGNREGGGYGRYVVIYHDNGHVTVYAHLHDVFVKAGDTVQKGQRIGTVGSTGNSTGPHLHFEIRVNGQRVNPLLFY